MLICIAQAIDGVYIAQAIGSVSPGVLAGHKCHTQFGYFVESLIKGLFIKTTN